MGRLVVAWCLGVSVPAAPSAEPALTRFEFAQTEMAVPVKLVFYAPDDAIATRAARAAFAKLHDLNGALSDYDPESELRKLCDTSGGGKAVPVSGDLWRVVEKAQEISRQSEGAFDVTVGPVVRLWRRARRLKQLPSPERLHAALTLVDYRQIRLDPQRQAVELIKPGVRLDLGGIAKGYALAEALAVLRKNGVNRALVEAGGDLALGDPPPERPGWRIGIAPPGPNGPPRLYLTAANTAVAASGDMYQFVEIGGKRYSHIVDPRTGLGLTDQSTVTVVAPDGATADALATAVSVLGPEKGLKLIDATPGAAAYIVRAPGDKVETFESKRWKELRIDPGRPT